MDKITFGLAIGGIFTGVLVTYSVAKYYFKKGQKEKALTPYLQFSSRLFQKIDPELKESLILEYKGRPIENMSQAQFLIANTGDFAIRDIIEPLKLTLPKEKLVFSANLIHIQPEGRKIDCRIDEEENSNSIILDIPLLNKGEFFVLKILYQDYELEEAEEEQTEKKREKASNYQFSITADDLPPNLEIQRLPFSYYEREKDKTYDWSAFWVAVIFGALSIIIFGVLYSFKTSSNNKYLLNFEVFFNSATFNVYNIFILLLAIIGLLTFILTIIGAVAAISEITPDKKRKFTVPSELRRKERYHIFDEFRS